MSRCHQTEKGNVKTCASVSPGGAKHTLRHTPLVWHQFCLLLMSEVNDLCEDVDTFRWPVIFWNKGLKVTG